MIIIDIDKQDQNGTTIFNILDNTTELWMTKHIIGEIFSSGGATLYKNPSDQTVNSFTVANKPSLMYALIPPARFLALVLSTKVGNTLKPNYKKMPHSDAYPSKYTI